MLKRAYLLWDSKIFIWTSIVQWWNIFFVNHWLNAYCQNYCTNIWIFSFSLYNFDIVPEKYLIKMEFPLLWPWNDLHTNEFWSFQTTYNTNKHQTESKTHKVLQIYRQKVSKISRKRENCIFQKYTLLFTLAFENLSVIDMKNMETLIMK